MPPEPHTNGRMPVLGLGAGGHVGVVIECLTLADRYAVVGLLDGAASELGPNRHGVPLLGGDEELPRLRATGIVHAFIGVGTPRNTDPRILLWGRLKELGFEVVSAVHPTAIVSSLATCGEGVTILARAVVNPQARLGQNVLINTGAIVEHDCQIGDHAHIASGAVLAGGVQVERGAFVGAGACIRPGIVIGAGAVVGTGAVVVKNVAAGSVVVGNPARPMAKQKPLLSMRAAS